MNDFIERQAAIEIASKECGEFRGIYERIKDMVDALPSAQPEKRTDKRTETHGMCLDAIDRQAVNDALDKLCNRECEYSKKQRYAMCDACHLGSAFDAIAEVPSAQPEIIRCGECSHKDKKIDYCHYLGITICERDYCSYAERRNDE